MEIRGMKLVACSMHFFYDGTFPFAASFLRVLDPFFELRRVQEMSGAAK